MTGALLRRRVNFFLLAALGFNLLLWAGSRDMYAKWAGVPPVPSRAGAVMMALGDPEFSYRSGALTLQNLGDGGGQTTPLKDYDYKKLGRWLWLLNELDPASDQVPYLAAYYFGVVRDKPEDTAVLVDYLAAVGQNPAGEKWRWLAQAAVLARHRMNDLHRALDIAYMLSKMRLTDGRDLPSWAREYPVFILKAEGDKASARQLMESILQTEKNLSPDEIKFMKNYLVNRLDTNPAEAEALVKARGHL